MSGKAIHIILLGPPGAGKGTIANYLVDNINITKISTGDILRANVGNQTKLGKDAEDYMNAGDLVPDTLVIQMVRDYFQNSEFPNGFLLDGFPRTIDQADALTNLLSELNFKLDGVVQVEVDDDELIRRITGRRTCSNCSEIYSITYNPPERDGICDKCGSKLIVREDETEDVIRTRLEVYRKKTALLIEYYKNLNMLQSYKHPNSNEIANMIKKDFLN